MNRLVGIFLALLFTFPALGSFQGFNSSTKMLGNFSKLKCDSSLSCSKTSGRFQMGTSGTITHGIAGDGGDALVGLKQNQVAATATTATIAQCGSTFINSGGAIVITLPEASTALGCRYTFVCGDANDFDVNPNDASDQILQVSTTNGTTGVVTLAPSAGDAIRCTDAGGSVTLEAVGANAWVQVGGGNGIWTDVN